MSVFQTTGRAFARERIRVTSGAVKTLTAATYLDGGVASSSDRRRAASARLVIDRDAGDMHFTDEGTDPTTAVDNTGVGSIAGPRDIVWLNNLDAITKFKAIALTATNVDVEVTYFR